MIPTIRVLAVAVALASPTFGHAAFETPPTLGAADVAPPELLSGPHYKVAPKATIEGYLAKFDVESDLGTFPALGTELLRIRISEIPAIASLSEVSQSGAFKDALAKSAAVPVDFAKNLATDPQRTVTNVAKGVGQLFGSAGRAVRQGAEYVGDKAADAKSDKSSAGNGSKPTFTDDPLGYNKAKRDWARKLSIDPYSTNPVLQEKLAAAAQATFAGNFSVGIAVGAVVGPLQYAVDFDKSTRDAVWDLSPGDLEARNEAKLAAMGITGRTVRDFFRTPSFTPTLATALVSALDKLGDAHGRAAVIAATPSIASEVQARFVVNALRMLSAYDKRGDRIVEIRMSGRVPVGVTKNGVVVVPAALDYVPWTQEVAGFVTRKELTGRSHVLLLAGKPSEAAKKELAARHWKVEERFALQS
jgi:hypothetical protein